jgi:hypothetical protein
MRYLLWALVAGSACCSGLALYEFVSGSGRFGAIAGILAVVAAASAVEVYFVLRRSTFTGRPQARDDEVSQATRPYDLPTPPFSFVVGTALFAGCIAGAGASLIGGASAAVVGGIVGALFGGFVAFIPIRFR